MSGNGTDVVVHLRLALTVTHLILVLLGTVNLLVIFLILLRPYMRSITNVYMIGLCMADFIYLTNLTMVAATQLNDKSWPFGSGMCSIYHGSESTGKFASVLFVVLLAADRYCAMCKASLCARYRNYRTAIFSSICAWAAAILFSLPLYIFADEVPFRDHVLCLAKWPSMPTARVYISVSSVVIFAIPLAVIVYCYYHILNKLREAVKGSKRLRRASSSRAPYHKVTRLVLWVVIFHVICWSPFWLFNLLSAIFRVRISTQLERIIMNIIHLFPYINCALNPVLYAVHAENFRLAFRSLFCWAKEEAECEAQETTRVSQNTRSTYYRTSGVPICADQNSTIHGISSVPLERNNSVNKGRALLDSQYQFSGTTNNRPPTMNRSKSVSSSRLSNRLSPEGWRKSGSGDGLKADDLDDKHRSSISLVVPAVTVTFETQGTNV